MRVILDTNVVVSLLLGSPTCQPLYEALRGGVIEPVLTGDIEEELRSVLGRRRLKIDPTDREEFLAVLRRAAIFLARPIPVRESSDPGDNAVLSAALTAGAIVITGDHGLQALHPFRGIVPILSPREFIERFLHTA